MAADVRQDQCSFSWPDPPMPARFFTEEGFAKYSMSSPPLMEVLQKIPEKKLRSGAYPPHYLPVLERLPLKGKAARDLKGLETLKPGFNYPHYSQMTEGLMKYFHFLKTKYGIKGERVVSEQEAKQHQQWVLFQKQVLKEQEEFQIFAKQVAMASANDFARFLPGAEEYLVKCLEANKKRVLGYPQLFRMNQTVSLKTDPVLPSDPQLTLLQTPKYQRDVRLLHWRQFKDDNHQYLCEVGNTPSSPEMHKETSSLSSEGSPEGVDIVISMDALSTLVDNHQLENYPHQWEIPFTVKTTQTANGQLQKTVFLEDPFMAHNYHPNTANNLLACNLMKEHLIKEGAQTILTRKRSGTQDQTRNFRRKHCVIRSSSVSQEESELIPVGSMQQDEDDPFGSNTDDITALETLGSGSFFSSTKWNVKPSKDKMSASAGIPALSQQDRDDPFGSNTDDITALETIGTGSFFSSTKRDVERSKDGTSASKFHAIQFVKSGLTLQDEKKALLESLDKEPPKMPLSKEGGSSQQPSRGNNKTPQESLISEETTRICIKPGQSQDPTATGEGGAQPASHSDLAECRTSVTSKKVDSTEADEKLGRQYSKEETKNLQDNVLSEDDIFVGDETDLIMDTSALGDAMRSCLAKNDCGGPSSGLQISDLSGEEAKEQGTETVGMAQIVTRGMARNKGKKTHMESDSTVPMSPPLGVCGGTSGSVEKRHTRSAVRKGRDGANMGRRTRSPSTSGEEEQISAKRTRRGRLVANIAVAENHQKGKPASGKKSDGHYASSSVVDKDILGAKRTRSGRVIGEKTSGKHVDGNSAVAVSLEDDETVRAKRTRNGKVIGDTATAREGVGNTQKKSGRKEEISSPTFEKKKLSVSLNPLSDEEMVVGIRKTQTGSVKSSSVSEMDELGVKRTRSEQITADKVTKEECKVIEQIMPTQENDMVIDSPILKGKPVSRLHPPPKEEQSATKRTTRSGKIIGTASEREGERKSLGKIQKEKEDQPIVVRRATRRRSVRSGKVIGTRNLKEDASNLQENVVIMQDSAKGVETLNIVGSDKAAGDGVKQKKNSHKTNNEAVCDGGSSKPQKVVVRKLRVGMSSDSESELKIDCSMGKDMSEDSCTTNKSGSSANSNSQGADNLNKDVNDAVPVVSAKSMKSAVGMNLPHDTSSDNELLMDVGTSDSGLAKGPSTGVIGGDSGREQSETLKIDSTSMETDYATACSGGASNFEAMKEGDNSSEQKPSEVKEISADLDGKILTTSRDRPTTETSPTAASDAIASMDDAISRRSGMEPTLPHSLQPQINLPGESSQSEQELLIDLGEDEFDGLDARGTHGKKRADKSPPKMRLRKERTSGESKASGTAITDPPRVETANPTSMPLLDNILELQKKLIASKKEVGKKVKTTPSPSKRASQTPGSVFDSIFQDQRELFKMKSEESVEAGSDRKKGGEAAGRAEVRSQIMMEEKADTSLWRIGKLKMCLRGGIDGIYWDYKAKKIKAASVYAKVEQQPWFGFEQVSMGEISRLWLKAALFPESSVLRGRIHCHSSELMKLEVLNINNIGAWTQFQPAYAVKVLHNVFTKLLTLSDGSYLLMHHAGGPQAFIYSTVEEATAHRFIIYDLHAEHQKATLHHSPPAEIPWAPLDPNMQLPRSDPWQIPCIFPPPPYVKAQEYYNTRQFNPYEGLREPRNKNKRKKKKKNNSESQAKQGAEMNQQQKKNPSESRAKTGAKINQQQGKPGLK